jgi:hypothetical protein
LVLAAGCVVSTSPELVIQLMSKKLFLYEIELVEEVPSFLFQSFIDCAEFGQRPLQVGMETGKIC